MSEMKGEIYWALVVGNEEIRLYLKELMEVAEEGFKEVSDNYKQKLVYNLLDAVKDNDQNRFFYVLLKAINKPKEEKFRKLWEELEKNYDIMPEEAFTNFAYSIILGVMKTYGIRRWEK